MTTWFTADMHFHHKNISHLTGRPWADLAEMNEQLIRPLALEEVQRWVRGPLVDDTASPIQ
jgi:calcineurin-like phosphoesterase family protein